MLEAPFPWFGGKSRVAHIVWERFGGIVNYVEPFFGSGAVMLGRPQPFKGTETINDLDGYVANFWRAVKHDPECVAQYADNPVNDNDLHARHIWLVQRKGELAPMLEADPDYHDPKIAGYWVWGISCWIGRGWCSGNGPWHAENGKLVICQRPRDGDADKGANRNLPHLGDAGRGVNRKLTRSGLVSWMSDLSDRLRGVRVCCGDWARVCGSSVTHKHGKTGVFLDPPYADTAGRGPELYNEDSQTVAHDVRSWAIENGRRDDMLIALCGYDGEHMMPGNWECISWKTKGGYESQAKVRTGNTMRERIWFSPACNVSKQAMLFEGIG